MAQKKFKTEVADLLNLIVHSLYTNKEIFIRELISNASDAIDKLKFLALTSLKDAKLPSANRIDILFDEKEQAWMKISDNGIGMNQEDLEKFLGTIANSGTRSFIKDLDANQQKSSELIGQFGVGFYSVFMVADMVTVTSKKAGETEAWQWQSKGVGTYQITEAQKERFGTDITITLNEAGKQFAEQYRIQEIIKKYSDHISHPIYLTYSKKEYDDKGKPKEEKEACEQINAAAALWKRNRSSISEKDHESFYKTISNDNDPPLFHLHVQAEGVLEYAALLYIPKTAPHDMFYSDFRTNIRLYIQRVFITDEQKLLLPTYLRFVRGIIDSEDLPLNISRETLQENTILMKIQNAIVKKILNKIGEIAAKQPQLFKNFITQYNRPLKEGLYQDFANRDQLLELVRFHSTASDALTSLSEYKSRAKDSQKSIYYITGSDIATLKNSPLLERYRTSNIEVLLLSDEIDEIVIPTLGLYKELSFKQINTSSTEKDDTLVDTHDQALEKKLQPLLARMNSELSGHVEKVVFSDRLDTSPACVLFADNVPSKRMQEMLKGFGQADTKEYKPLLEINPKHSIIQALETITNKTLFHDFCMVLLEQSMLIENIPFKNSNDFVARINRIVAQALDTDVPQKAQPKQTPKEPPKQAQPKQEPPKQTAQEAQKQPPKQATQKQTPQKDSSK